MSFASVSYFMFFIVIAALCAITGFPSWKARKWMRRFRHGILLVASYLFYGVWDWRFCFLMLSVTSMAYLAARGTATKWRRLSLCGGIMLPLLALGLFKYYNFFLESFCRLLQINGDHSLRIILPVGISFYTFQALSYVIDVSRGKIPCERDFLHVALYISFFPQLVAGPIVKAQEFLPQLSEDRNISVHNLKIGAQIFVMGLFKKVVLADWLSVFVDEVFAMPEIFHGGTVLLAILSYSMQIYLDFSGYSDMAIGSAKCLGYDLTPNFNLPYISENVTEFWRRWHISLSTWLREYVYIPLGGNRGGVFRTYWNLMLTMALGGLWHGAAWSFVVWGTLHGAALCVHKAFSRRKIHFFSEGNKLVQAANIFLTYCFVSFCWVFFRAADMREAHLVLRQCLVWESGVSHLYVWTYVSVTVLLAATGLAALRSLREGNEGNRECNGFYPVLDLSRIAPLTLFFVFVGITVGLAYTGSNPFVYFQF